MKKSSISIHKSFLKKQVTSISTAKNNKSLTVINPGNFSNTVMKPAGLKQKTDRGSQLLTLSYYKKCLNSTKIQNNRLDLVLFYLKFSRSLSESKHLISQRLVKVNGVLITNVTYILRDFSIIECNNNNSYIIIDSLSHFIIYEVNYYYYIYKTKNN